MAILEIARIQVRRGQENITGVPQLDSGEFGWALDTQQLYIGNGSLAEGAPTEGNTRIMTEHDLFAIYDIPAYNYIGHSPAAPLITSPYNDEDDIVRTIQSKLDDFVTIYDFGGSSDAEGYNDLNLQQALNQLYLNSDKAEYASRVALRIPAGHYIFSSTVYIPPNTTIIGDGQDKTVLEQTSMDTALFTFFDYELGPIQQGSFSESFRPRSINLMGITFKYADAVNPNTVEPLVHADCSEKSYFIDCKFVGNYVPTETVSTDSYTGLYIRSQGAAVDSNNLRIEGCSFENLYYGIKSNHDIEDTIITNSKFKNLHRGIVFNESLEAGNNLGAMRSKIHNNRFELIEAEAIFVGTNTDATPSYNVSSYNTFKEVGNGLAGDLGTGTNITSIINFQTPGNVSKGDFFVRLDSINSTSTSAMLAQTVEGSAYVSGESVYVKNIDMASDALFKLPHNGKNQMFKLQYTALWSSQKISRTGEIIINAATFGVNPSAEIIDNYTYTGPNDGGLVFTANLDLSTNVISIDYNSSSVDGTISYQYNQLQ